MQQSLPPLTEAFALFQAGRVSEAIKIIEDRASVDDADALFTLGDIYWRGAGVPQDLARGRELFRRSSDAGQPMGIRAYTNLLASGIAGERNWSRAVERLTIESRSDFLRNRMLEVVRAMKLTASGDPVETPIGERLSEHPDVLLFRGAFTAGECDFLRLLAEPTYQRSIVGIGSQNVPDPMRTSDGSTIHWLIEDPATHAINSRLAALTRTRAEQGEPLQILRYRPGQQYYPHVDWLGDENRRVTTALIYLNDDYAGGETAFVKTGLAVKGRKGDVLAFRSVGPDNEFDPLSEHAGLPVKSGTKYLASRWIREARYTP
jgi:prolyl 4-hydroxylase